MDYSLILLVAGCVFLGALMRSTFGFGDAVVSMPLLALLPIPFSTAAALVGLVGFTVALFFAVSGWKDKDPVILKKLTGATVVGIPFGLLLVRFARAEWVSLILGLLLMVYAMYSLYGPKTHHEQLKHRFRNTRYALPFGFVSGMLGSAYNMNGTPIVIYATIRDWDPKSFKGNVQSHFILSSSFILVSHFLSGFWTKEVGVYFIFSIPGVLLAIYLGNVIYGKIKVDKFKTMIFYLIFLLGVISLFDFF
ncbi:sulfite exporter TauE/SafE family protein [Alkalibacterium sp. MB6]|uniref:sulfite exporter TauE/SafE family protein n=1 Tax=Alkalibacterium sp. MB6 TaxID=2081965 RepID=UPI00137942E8|nr:sulfite exporter TauE/SafE family protein [Alkalibacterium sp. MB6]